jgi:hypothetical protein
MKAKYRIIGVTVVAWSLILLTGCVNENGQVNGTETGALVGGVAGALLGAAGGGKYAGVNAVIGAAIGAGTGALVGHMIDEDQRERLREQSPQTLQTIDQNDEIAQQQASAPPPDPSQPAPTPANAPTPLKVDDIKALTSAGVKPDAIIEAIKESQAPPYSAGDIQAAQQANPPVDPSVIAYMQNPA